MKMFGLGALWAAYALVLLVLSQTFMNDKPDLAFRIASPDFYRPGLPASVQRVRHDRDIRSQCASWTTRNAIHDHVDGTATYVTECNSVMRAVLINITTGIMIVAPVIILFLLRRRLKNHA